MRTRHRSIFTATLAVAAWAAAPAGHAVAGNYVVATCLAKNANFSERLFTPFATRSMQVNVDCLPERPRSRRRRREDNGWLVGSLSRVRSRVPVGARAGIRLTAPRGASFDFYRWSGKTFRSHCGFSVESYARGPRGRTELTGPGKANYAATTRRCKLRLKPGRPAARAAAAPPRTTGHGLVKGSRGATELVHTVTCRVRTGCAAGGTSVEVYLADLRVVDYTRPAVAILPQGRLATGQWVSGEQALNYVASDNVGVQRASVLKGTRRIGPVPRPCDHTRLIPCANGPGSIGVSTTDLPEGTQPLAVEAVDSAGNVGRALTTRPARVDNTPPPRVAVGVVGGEGWRRTPSFALTWTNSSEGDRAPIAAVRYRVCRRGTTQCSVGRGIGLGISRLTLAPAPGEHTVTAWREDAAGNQEQDNESVPVTLRYDPEVPQPAFEPQSSSDPTRVSVAVTDRISGLARGAVEISRVGSRVWQTLPTAKEGSRLVARIDDSRLPPGQYALRARAFDQAGNEASTERRADGYPVVVTLPVRVASKMRAGAMRRKTLRQKRRSGRRVRRRITVLQPARRVRFGRSVRIAGRLANRHGGGIPGARVHVLTRTPTSAEQHAAVIATDSRGRYRYTARATSTRTLRFAYAGTRLILPAQQEVTLKVPAASTIRVSRRRVRNGGRVVFRGRLRSPAAGKLMELQVKLSGRYQTFLTTRTGPDGRWAATYRFRRSCGVTGFRFRARIPREASYPFETGRSRSRAVRVLGPRCP
jgi:hypothetical protein